MTTGGDAAWNGDEPASDFSKDMVALVHHTIGLVEGLAPSYWFLENPVGRLRTVLGTPSGTITQCQYGRNTQKPTDLYGDHPPMTYRRCSPGDGCHTTTGSYSEGEDQSRLGTLAESDDAAERAKLPYDLSDAIREACEAGLRGDAPEQSEMGAFL